MRRQARQWALMILYGIDVARGRADRSVEAFFDAFASEAPLDPPPSWDRMPAYRVWVAPERMSEARAWTRDRVAGVEAARAAIDDELRRVSQNWRLERMAVLDRNILRLAAFEILHRRKDVPRSVAINEAVELAKTFGERESGAFVNGILDRVGKAG